MWLTARIVGLEHGRPFLSGCGLFSGLRCVVIAWSSLSRLVGTLGLILRRSARGWFTRRGRVGGRFYSCFLFFSAFPAAFAASVAFVASVVAINRTGPTCLTCCRIRSKTSAGFSFEFLGMVRFVNACNISEPSASCVRSASSMSHLTTSLRHMTQRTSASVLIRAKMRTSSCFRTPQPNISLH